MLNPDTILIIITKLLLYNTSCRVIDCWENRWDRLAWFQSSTGYNAHLLIHTSLIYNITLSLKYYQSFLRNCNK